MVGWFSTSKNSAERRCASRFGSDVSMLAASMRTETRDDDGLCSSKSTTPCQCSNAPRTFEMTMWRTQKWMAE